MECHSIWRITLHRRLNKGQHHRRVVFAVANGATLLTQSLVSPLPDAYLPGSRLQLLSLFGWRVVILFYRWYA